MDRDDEALYHAAMLERQRETEEALQRCAEIGADEKTLEILARECGLSNWKPNEARA